MVLHGLADVLEVHLHRLADVDALQGGPQPLGQLHGVVPGAVGGAEAGHGDGDDVAGWPVQQLHGHGGDQDGRVESSPPDRPTTAAAARVCSSRFFRPRRPPSKFHCNAPTGPHILGDKGGWIDVAGEGGGARLQGEVSPADPQAVGLPHGSRSGG